MRSPMRVASALVVFFGLTLLSWSQSATTSLRGTVTDANGAVVANATITLTDPQTGFSRSAKTSNQGEYQFLQVPPATYVVTAAAPGFANMKQEGVRLLVSTPGTLDFTMKVASASETIEVRAEAELVNTQDATLGHAFGTEKIENLPFEGRDPVAILSLQPGVAYVGSNVDQSIDSRGGSVNGARSDQTNVTLDGIDNNDQLQGLAFQGALRATLDSLQEFRVTTSGSNADTGRSSGAQVNLVTKSGTNSFHGSVYEYHRPSFTTANDWFIKRQQIESGQGNVPPKLIRNTFGATFGGPIKKDRAFFFLAYEGMRKRESALVTRVVPSETLRQGIVRYIDVNGNVQTLSPQDLATMDPNCSTPVPGFPNGTCPLGPGPNPAVMSIFQQYPMPNSDSVGDGLNYRGFVFAAPFPENLNTYIAKLDFNLTSSGNHRLFVRGGLQGDSTAVRKEPNSQTGDSGPEFPGMPSNLTGANTSKGIIVNYNGLLRSNLINSLRYGFIRQGFGTNGLKQQHFVHFRGLDDPQGFTTSIANQVPVHNIVDDLSWIKGKHTLQFGGNFRFIDNNQQTNRASFTTATTNVSWLDNAGIAGSGSSLDPAAFGFPAVADSFTQSYDSPVAALVGLVTEVDATYVKDKTGQFRPEGEFLNRLFRSHEAEFYVQDAWRVKPNLTLTIGLRYSLLQPPFEVHGNQIAPSVSLNDFFRKRGEAMQRGETYAPIVSLDLSGQANGKRPYWDWDYRDFAPRFAFAWASNADHGILRKIFGGAGKSSLRGGYGLYFDHFGSGITRTFDRNGSFGLITVLTNPAGIQSIDTAARFSDLFTIPATSAATTPNCSVPPCNIQAPPPPAGFPATPPADLDSGFAITWGLDDRLKTPYSHVFDLSFTRELPGGFTFEGSYVGRLGRRLLQEEDLAMPLNIRDPQSGMDYFTAATALTQAAQNGVDINSLAPIPYWENLFPTAAGNLGFGPPGDPNNLGCATGNNVNAANYTATQAMYDMYSCFSFNETTALFLADLLCLPACATLPGQSAPAPFAFFDPQWSSLYAWRTIGNSSYHAAQFSLRHRMSHGLSMDFNYTLSKSIDIGSNAERINEFEGFGLGSQIINSWSPNQLRAVSDFDTRHQINANWVYELPVGRGRTFGSGLGRWADAIFGGWQTSGLFRWSSGFPFSVGPGLGFWGTNWQLTSNVFPKGKLPKTGTFIVDGNPNVFKDGTAAANAFRLAFPGESGQRNNLRGPGFFGIDLGLGKSWKITESQALQFRWEVFNVTNSVRFDVGSMSFNNGAISSSSFGNYLSTLTSPRLMQFALRYTF